MPTTTPVSATVQGKSVDACSQNGFFSKTAYTPQRILFVLLGSVLLSAAAVKAYHLLFSYTTATTFLTSTPVSAFTVEVEILLGFWLLSGFYSRWAYYLVLVYFIGLGGISTYLLTVGAKSCGCFGSFAIHPWYTFLFNLTAISALLLCPIPKSNCLSINSRPSIAACFLVPGTFLMVFFGVAVSNTTIPTVSSHGIAEHGELVVVDFENLVGSPLPILPHVNIGKQIEKGKWTLIFYHSLCSDCEMIIGQAAKQPAESPVAIIEVPTTDGMTRGLRLGIADQLLNGTLSTSRRWIIETPKIVQIEDGLIQNVLTELP